MPLRLNNFSLDVTGRRVSFHDGFADMREVSHREHSAIDIGAPEGTPILSTTYGLVVRTWTSKNPRRSVTGCGMTQMGGNVVLIVDGNGYCHYYAHMRSAPLVLPGRNVKAGTLLGYVGTTGQRAHGSHPHLHYQVWEVGSSRGDEMSTGIFARPFGRSINPYNELHSTSFLRSKR